MNITIIGGLNWFGKGMIETTMHYKYFFNIIDNCSSPNSCKTCFGDIKHLEEENYIMCYTRSLRNVITRQCQFVIFNISSSKDFIKNQEITNLFFETCLLCKEFDIKIIYSLDQDEFSNNYKNTVVNKLGCRYACIQHNSNIIGEMKVRDKIEEMVYYLSIMNRVDLTNQEFRYTTTKQVIYTYLQALSIDGYLELPYQSINETSIFYTIQNKLPKDKYLYYRLNDDGDKGVKGDICKEIVLEDYIYPLVEKYFRS
jgi:hypothetical protein